MKKPYIPICLSVLTILASCIEDYDGVGATDLGEEILIVEGQIVGETECEFRLQRSEAINNDSEYKSYTTVYGKVDVICSNGEVFGTQLNMEGTPHYCVKMGKLDPNETYHLRIHVGQDVVFESEPMRPLPSPAIKHLSYTLDEDSINVELRLSTEDPHGEAYYRWTYDEYWEVNTPLETNWIYDPQAWSIIPLHTKINRGWASKTVHKALIGNNLDYGNGALHDYPVYTVRRTNNRFNTRYYTKVRQLAISRAEYEYYKQLEVQTTETGGLFTLMPSQLPTNIHCNQGHKVIGYIGVHLNATEAEIYINRDEAKYKPTYVIEIMNDSIVKRQSSLQALYNGGWQVYHYDQVRHMSEWTKTWCVDCRDPFWGASLKRPDFWEDN